MRLVAILGLGAIAATFAVVLATGADAASTLLSQGKPATASSIEDAGTPASAAVDGNTGTRWSSQFTDPQWLQVDLGASASITQVVLQWEAAYATAFQIQTSTDGTTWTSIYSTTTGTGGTQTLNVTGTGRYVRMYGTARVGGYGYSLWEFQVYGSIGGGTGPTCGTDNAALNKPASASSSRGRRYPGLGGLRRQRRYPMVVAFSDPQWIQVDLGSAQPICQVVLQLGGGVRHGLPGPDVDRRHDLDDRSTRPRPAPAVRRPSTSPATGRYVRMYGTARATGYGYSLWEFAVHVGGAPTSPTRQPVAVAVHLADRLHQLDLDLERQLHRQRRYRTVGYQLEVRHRRLRPRAAWRPPPTRRPTSRWTAPGT